MQFGQPGIVGFLEYTNWNRLKPYGEVITVFFAQVALLTACWRVREGSFIMILVTKISAVP